jgi:hypothetical protein
MRTVMVFQLVCIFWFPRQNPVRSSVLPCTCWCPSPFMPTHYITQRIYGELYKLCSCSLRNFLQARVICFLFGRNTFLSTLSSNTFSLCSSLNVTDHVSHSYKTTGKIIVLYIPVFVFLHIKGKDKRFWTELHQAFHEFNFLLISLCVRFWFDNVRLSANVLNSN